MPENLFTLISTLILLVYPIILGLYFMNKFELSSTQIIGFTFLLIFSLSFISTKLIPGGTFDLSVYYRVYDRYQITHELGNEFSNNVILFKFIMLFLCNLPNKEFIQFTFVSVTYLLIFLCFFCIYRGFLKKDNPKTLILSLLMQETLMSFAYIYSGSRNQVAFGLIALSLILYYLYGNKKIYFSSLFLAVSSFLIHDSTIMIIGLFLCSLIPFLKKHYYFIIGWGLLIPIIIFLFQNIEFGVIASLVDKLILYVNNAMNTLDLRIAFTNTIVTIVLLFVLKINPINNKKINNFLSIVLSFTLGAIIIPEIQRRMLYFISYFSPFFITSIINIENKKIRGALLIVCVVFIIGLALYHFINLKANGIAFNII